MVVLQDGLFYADAFWFLTPRRDFTVCAAL